MKRLHLTTAMVFFILAACTDSKPTYTVPSRVLEHDASSCPSDIEGKYENSDDPTSDPTRIYKRADGTLVMGSTKPSGDELPVTGEPKGDPSEGQASAICADGRIQLEMNTKSGHFRATLTKVGQNISMYIRVDNGNHATVTLRRL